MTGYTFEDAVRDRDEAYRLLAQVQVKLDEVEEVVAAGVRVHEPGGEHCPDRDYGDQCPSHSDWHTWGPCDGIAHYGEDPYQAEINDDYTKVWLCDGVSYGASQDI